MGEATGIEWTDHSWNSWRGCAKPPANEDGTGIAPECWHCYAEAWAKRQPAIFGEWGKDAARVSAAESYWNLPLLWARKARAAGVRRKVFCLSMGDIFEDRADLAPLRARTFEMIDRTPELDYLLLTKRPQDVPRLWPGGRGRRRRNVWLGTSCGANGSRWRVDALKKSRDLAELLFVSAEPLVEPLDLAGRLDGIAWLIAGGESRPVGREPRPVDVGWFADLIRQCREAGTAFFLKQLGGNVEACDSIDAMDPFPGDVTLSQGKLHHYNARVRLKDRKGGDMAEWPEGLRIREFPAVAGGVLA